MSRPPGRRSRLHTLYLGSRDGGPFTPRDRQAVVRETASVFAGFTLSEAQGYERRRPVATLRLEIACADTHRVLALARRLRRLLDQRAVGLAVDGRFTTVSD